jgi:hypothetical protein
MSTDAADFFWDISKRPNKQHSPFAFDVAARQEYREHAAVNFPDDQERQVIPSRLSEGLCPQGHSLQAFGRWSQSVLPGAQEPVAGSGAAASFNVDVGLGDAAGVM